MSAAVIVFPGSNNDRDTKVALERITGRPVSMVWHQETSLPPCDVIVLPGGFAHGDYLRCGAIAVHSPIMREVVAKARGGTPTLGICNGFQVLCESGLLPGVLMRNGSLRFVCRDVHLKVERNTTFFTTRYDKGAVIRVPVAHHDGNYFADAATLDELENDGRVVFRYVTPDGAADAAANPNGSQNNIAGISNDTGRVVGMMPHPERLYEPALGGSDGRAVFESIVEGLVH